MYMTIYVYMAIQLTYQYRQGRQVNDLYFIFPVKSVELYYLADYYDIVFLFLRNLFSYTKVICYKMQVET